MGSAAVRIDCQHRKDFRENKCETRPEGSRFYKCTVWRSSKVKYQYPGHNLLGVGIWGMAIRRNEHNGIQRVLVADASAILGLSMRLLGQEMQVIDPSHDMS